MPELRNFRRIKNARYEKVVFRSSDVFLSLRQQFAYIQKMIQKNMLGHELMIGQALIRPICKIVFISFNPNLLNYSLYFAGLTFCFAAVVFETCVKKTSLCLTLQVCKRIFITSVCSTENFLYFPLGRNFEAKIYGISVGIF